MATKKIFFISILCILIVGTYHHYRQLKKEQKTGLLQTESPTERTIEQYIKASGTLKAKEQLIVGSLVYGRMLEWYVDANDTVKKDQLLAKLDDGIGYAGVEKALAVLQEKKAEQHRAEQLLNRYEVLVRTQAISQDDYDKQKSQLELAIARLDGAKADLKISQLKFDNLSIKSPDDGTVIARNIDVGQMVTAQLQATEMFIIAKDLKQMEATIDVDESDIGQIAKDQNAYFIVDAFPTKEFTAKVVRAENLPKNAGTVISYSVILNVDNADLQLKPGMTTNVHIKICEKNNALSIPQRALRLSKTGILASAKEMGLVIKELPIQKNIRTHQSSVWVIDGQELKQTTVELGANDSEFVEIISGLDRHAVIVSGINKEIAPSSILSRSFGMKSPIGGK
jgi:HlyD family secretion protein